MSAKKIGILGGSFNPIHKGHLRMAKAARDEYGLDEVWLVPTGFAPHKDDENMALSYSRKNMIELLLSEEPDTDRIILKDLECKSADKNYTYKTISYIHENYPEDELFYIVGEDSIRYFHNWVHPEIITAYSHILVVERNASDTAGIKTGGISPDEMDVRSAIDYVKEKIPGQYSLLSIEPFSMSSSDIRNSILSGADISKAVGEKVSYYIKDHLLYNRGDYDKDLFNDIQEKLQKRLKNSRYQHTLGVMNTAGSLAMKYDYPVDKAMLAGLLHDCAKGMTEDEQIEYCNKHDIALTESELSSPQLIHAKLGSYLCRNKYNVDDKDICHAIQVHTTGCPEMNLLDKILYIADYIEPNRMNLPRLFEIRQSAFEDPDRTLIMILHDTVAYLDRRNMPADPKTKETYEYYKKYMIKQGKDISLIID